MTFGVLQIIGCILLLLGAWAILIEPLWIEDHLCELEIPGLSPELDGLRLGFISDTHCGSWAPRAFFDRAWSRLRRHAPDILLIGGDIVVNHAKPGWQLVLEGLRGFDPPLGKYAVLGGHDRTYNAAAVTAAMEELGVTVLHNRSLSFTNPRGTWWLTGLADNSDIPIECSAVRALIGVPADAPAIAFVHSPDFVLTPEADRFSLVLSGHTHAGQVRLPWWGSILRVTALPRRYDHGFSRPRGINLFVSRGLGCTVRLRFFCRPEICLLTLRRAPGASQNTERSA